jgi:hypothetical protein
MRTFRDTKFFQAELGRLLVSCGLVTIVNNPHRTRDCCRILEPMIALAHCSKLQRIIVAGEKSIELMFELERLGYRVASTANCGRPTEQYDVALVDWRKRTFRALEKRSTGLSIF